LKTEMESPAIMSLRDDPTAVFVILGYADPKGDEKRNIDISQSRADAVLLAMRDKCNIQNVMHAVAMGGSTLLDAQNLEKNRIVEVWAVLP
jgi:outer membrane protein OmpA-like peptidoglycan-associated protein